MPTRRGSHDGDANGIMPTGRGGHCGGTIGIIGIMPTGRGGIVCEAAGPEGAARDAA